jgi:hypothetical protein
MKRFTIVLFLLLTYARMGKILMRHSCST